MNHRLGIYSCAAAFAWVVTAGCGGGTTCDEPHCPDNTNCNTASQVPLGNVGLTAGEVPATGVAGTYSELRFTVKADTIKLNTYVRLTLVPQGGDESQSIPVGATVIDLLEPGEEREVIQPYLLPADLPAGTYLGVYTLNAEDYFPEDDLLQGEAPGDAADNTLIAPDPIVISVPNAPVLEIQSTALDQNSFTVSRFGPASQRDATALMDAPDLMVNQEIVSWAVPVTDPVDVQFDLALTGDATQVFRLQVVDLVETADGTAPVLHDRATLPVTCRDPLGASVSPDDPGARCASLHASSPVGRSYRLVLPDEAWVALGTRETTCELVITVDPDQRVAVWNGDRDRTVVRLPVRFLPGDAPGQALVPRSLGPYYVYDPIDSQRQWGNGNFNVGYHFESYLKYWTTNWTLPNTSIHLPCHGEFKTEAALPVTVFGKKTDLIDLNAEAKLDVDHITSSYVDYGIQVAGYQVWGNRYGLTGSDGSADPVTLFTADKHYSVAKDLSVTVWIAVIPVSVSGGIRGTLGLKGYAQVKPQNVLELAVGPYFELWVRARAGIGDPSIAAAGIGGEFLVVRATQYVRPRLQFQPSYPRAMLGVDFPFILDTLDGRLFLWYQTAIKSGEYDLVSWTGMSWELSFINPLVWTWGYDSTFSLGLVQNYQGTEGFAFEPNPDDDTDAFVGFYNCHPGHIPPPDPNNGCYRFNVIWVGDQFALQDLATGRYVTYVPDAPAPASHLQLLPHAGDPGPEHLFRRYSYPYYGPDGYVPHVYAVETHDGHYWSCGACGDCDGLDATLTAAQLGSLGDCIKAALFHLDFTAPAVSQTP